MNINKDKFLCILGKNIYSINYALLNENISKGLISFTGDNCQAIFEKNGVNSNFQKIFIKLSLFNSILKKKNNGFEYLTNVPIEIFKNSYYDYTISGEMFGNYPGCRFNNAYYCNEKDILEFISNIT